ncbi:aldo/keto reductase, partial [bacterium]
RDIERDVVPMLKGEGVGLLVWSPLAGGFLSGKYGRDLTGPEGSRRQHLDFPPVDVERAYNAIDVMRTVAETRGVSVAQIALAWLLHQKTVSSVIIGTRKIQQLEDNIGATTIGLNEDELKAIEEASRLPAEYPGWMLDMWGQPRAQQLQDSHT